MAPANTHFLTAVCGLNVLWWCCRGHCAETVTHACCCPAGPARFKLTRSVAKLWLPPKPHADAALELVVRMHSGAATPVPAALTDSASTDAQEAAQESEAAGGADSSPAGLLRAVGRASQCQGCLEILQLPKKAPPRLQASRRQ